MSARSSSGALGGPNSLRTMRLWTLHPKYLDPKGLAALWREALLAQSVLRGQTKAYARHPQLVRFRETRTPVRCVAEYLRVIGKEGEQRGYKFDSRKIARGRRRRRLLGRVVRPVQDDRPDPR